MRKNDLEIRSPDQKLDTSWYWFDLSDYWIASSRLPYQAAIMQFTSPNPLSSSILAANYQMF